MNAALLGGRPGRGGRTDCDGGRGGNALKILKIVGLAVGLLVGLVGAAVGTSPPES